MFEYNVIVKLSIYFSVWLLSCILLYTYNHKSVSNIEYNKMMSKMNTQKLKQQMNTLNNKIRQYRAMAYPTEMMDTRNEDAVSGLAEAKKGVYTELIKTIEMYDKCNLVRPANDGGSFPWSEVLVAGLLIAIVIGVILVFNMTNNPFKTMDKRKEIEAIGAEIDQTFGEVETNLDSEGMLDKTLDAKYVNKLNERFTGGARSRGTVLNPVQLTEAAAEGYDQGGVSDKMQGTYNNILMANMKISSKIAKLQTDMTFSYIVVAVSIVMLTLYVSIQLFKNAMRFTDTLYSGSLFMNSRCYNM